jgi:hypothetical protein
VPDVPIPRDKVESLSDKLDNLQKGEADKLTDDEARILHGIFAVAADVLSPSGDGHGRTNLVEVSKKRPSLVRLDDGAAPSLGEQFRRQFLDAFEVDPPDEENSGGQRDETQDETQDEAAPGGNAAARAAPAGGQPVAPRPRASFIIPGIIPGPGDGQPR